MMMKYGKKITSPGYYWCSVGGNPLEICEVSETSKGTGIFVARTIGCPDPFFIENSTCALILYTQYPVNAEKSVYDMAYYPTPVRLPKLPEHMGGEKLLPSRGHSWRGPRPF